MKTGQRKTGLSRLLEIAGRKKFYLLCAMALGLVTTVAQFVPFVAIYKILVELVAHAATPETAVVLGDARLVYHKLGHGLSIADVLALGGI